MSEQSFKSDFNKVGLLCRDWWLVLANIDPATREEKIGGRADRAELAKLRRIGLDGHSDIERVDTIAACQLWSYRELRSQLQFRKSNSFCGANADDDFDQAVAVVATTLARVRTETTKASGVKTAHLLGLDKDGKLVKDGDDAAARRMAEVRFKRLIRVRDYPSLLDQGRRIVHLLNRDVPVADLGASLFLWNSGPIVTRRWSFAYYGVDFADRSDTAAPDTADAA